MSAARWLSFYWSPERQEIACDGERFAHPVATNTSASHDVAHLVVAASGLPWRPTGTREEICFAEFNAIFVEHLALRVLDEIVLGRGGGSALGGTQEHARWFVETHYAPFPVDFDEALSRLRSNLDLEATVRLSPVLFRTRLFELAHDDSRERSIGGTFSSCFEPTVGAELSATKDLFARTLQALAAPERS